MNEWMDKWYMYSYFPFVLFYFIFFSRSLIPIIFYYLFIIFYRVYANVTIGKWRCSVRALFQIYVTQIIYIYLYKYVFVLFLRECAFCFRNSCKNYFLTSTKIMAHVREYILSDKNLHFDSFSIHICIYYTYLTTYL